MMEEIGAADVRACALLTGLSVLSVCACPAPSLVTPGEVLGGTLGTCMYGVRERPYGWFVRMCLCCAACAGGWLDRRGQLRRRLYYILCVSCSSLLDTYTHIWIL